MVIVQIATLPDREAMLWQTVKSLYQQADAFYIMLNGHTEEPRIPDPSGKIRYELLDNSLGDAAKFKDVEKRDGYFFAIDDDLIAPNSYIEYLKRGIDKYNGLVSLHGRNYPPNPTFKKWVGNYRCLNTVPHNVNVNFIGSGCCGFHTDRLKLKLSDFPTKNMADCYLSRAAYLQGIPMVVLAHKQGYLQYMSPPTTIWDQTRDYTLHNRVLQSYLK
jgi:hypothetical protein